MAAITDVFDALTAIIAGVVYPAGVPPAGTSSIIVNGTPIDVRIYAGWPLPENLDNDMTAGIADVSIYAPKGHWKNTTRYPRNEMQLTAPVHTIITTVFTNHVIISGAIVPGTPQNVAILVDGVGVSYHCLDTDTPTSIALALAALLTAQGVACDGTAGIVTIYSAIILSARVGGAGTTIREVMRQMQRFQVTVWAPSAPGGVAPDSIRTALADPLVTAFAVPAFLTLSDGSAARIITAGVYLSDDVTKPGVYRQDMLYDIEFPTTQTQTEYEIVLMKINLTGGVNAATPIGTYIY